MTELDPSDPLAYFEACFRQSEAGLGRVTVAVLGRVGAGKSTLVNAVFGESVAAVGVGAPVTAGLTELRAAGVPLTLLDSPGLELGGGAADEAADELGAVIVERARAGASEALHVVWYCVDAEQARLEPAEERLLARCVAAVPTIVVLTKALDAGDELRAHVEGLGLALEAVLPVLAEPRRIAGREIASHGLGELVAVTVSALPEAAKRAFVVAQRHAIDAKLVEARALAARFSLEAGSLGTVGELSTDRLARHQLRLLAEISAVYSLEVGATQRETIVRAVTRGASTTEAVARRVLELLKDAGLPGTDIVGALVTAGTAAASTRILGEAYARLCRELALRELTGDAFGESELVERFLTLLRDAR
jgi:predicted GTPase